MVRQRGSHTVFRKEGKAVPVPKDDEIGQVVGLYCVDAILGTTFIRRPPRFDIVYPRVKEIGGRRYVYLVEGAREGRRVKQTTLCYLGSMSKLASGVPERTKRKIDERFRVGWRRVDERIAKIPLTFQELSEARRDRYVFSVKNRRQASLRTQGDRQRAEGELVALSRIASARFRETFEEVGERSYRMR